MITDKDREELRELTRQIRSTKIDGVVFFDYGWNECAEIIMRYVNKKCTESAEQARKEAAEVAVAFVDNNMAGLSSCDVGLLTDLRTAILDDSASDHIPDTGKKLAIAVKALEDIKEMR